MAAAERRGIPTQRLNTDSLVQLGYGKYPKLIQATETSQTSAVAVEIACDKALTKLMLERAFIPVPRGTTVTTADAAVAAFHDLGVPVVVKPRAACQGVSLNLTTPDGVVQAFELAHAFSPDVIVEELFVGCDYRALMVGGQLVAASERRPAHVVGDGAHTIAELIDLINQNPLRGDDHEQPLTKITIDSILMAHLAKQQRNLDHVLFPRRLSRAPSDTCPPRHAPGRPGC